MISPVSTAKPSIMRIFSTVTEAHSTRKLRVTVGDQELDGVLSVKIGNDDGVLLPEELVQVTITCICVLG
jgi:hypothetical protein